MKTTATVTKLWLLQLLQTIVANARNVTIIANNAALVLTCYAIDMDPRTQPALLVQTKKTANNTMNIAPSKILMNAAKFASKINFKSNGIAMIKAIESAAMILEINNLLIGWNADEVK